jgi:hypothetical protein
LKYFPNKLEQLFYNKIKELRPMLSSDYSDKIESFSYYLETLCKEFLYILIYEKPVNIHMSHINLYNFDKAIMEMIKHYKYKNIDEDIQLLEAGIKRDCQTFLGAFDTSSNGKNKSSLPMHTADNNSKFNTKNLF